jgi:voltage-gated potassium channel
MAIKKHCRQILDTTNRGDRTTKVFNISLLILILFNVFFNIISTVDSINDEYEKFFNWFELISIIIFTIEYIFRIWCCTENRKYSKSIKGRLKYMTTPLMLVDLIAILPFYITLGNFSLTQVRIFRMLRVFKILKVGRYYSASKMFLKVLKKKKEELILTSIIMILLLVVGSSLLYYLESENFSSIPDAMWWTVLTLTTVGFNTPIKLTLFGRLITALIAIAGIGLFALPISILGSGFIEEISEKKKGLVICPNCGEEIEHEKRIRK